MFSIIYLPFALGLKIIKYVMNYIYLCTFIVTKIIAKSQFEKLTIFKNYFKRDFTPLQDFTLCYMF